MTPTRRRRLLIVLSIIVGAGLATTLVVFALKENMLFFYRPAEVAQGLAPVDTAFRMGGMVVDGSVVRADDSLAVQFDLTDYQETITVQYEGILPDLFREGQGIIAQGKLSTQGVERPVFEASEVLAKHDETYMPPEVADALEQSKAARGETTP
ncbi:MAG: cytochrome c-type biogenesis protein CcmE [Lysobacteraceae bacterium]|nr:MAG: cytochrome c-type biogenesis protein CcmE [Xanthomonadaceae bacterium]